MAGGEHHEAETVNVVELEETDGDENKERGNWGSKMDFILSCTGYAVGLGNVWRFPYLTFRNGGGAFLIPYFTMLLLAGLPIFFLEVSFGQYCSQGPITAWRSVPMMKGIGYGMVLANYYVGISYNVIIMYSLYYLFASFTTDLPWTGCKRDWNTKYCSKIPDDCFANGTIFTVNGTCVNITSIDNDVLEEVYNVTTFDNGTYDTSSYKDPLKAERRFPSEEYWKRQVLQESSSLNETGGIVWELALTLLLAWVIIFLCLIRGIKSSGKVCARVRQHRQEGLIFLLDTFGSTRNYARPQVVYVTATFPYIVLVILLVRGLTLEGYYTGVKFFITPTWAQIAEPKVWLDAAVQIFYSLSAAWGGLLTLASYNKFHNNSYFDAMLIPSINCATSLLAGFVIFSIIGFMATDLGVEVKDVADSGFGLAFIAYPEAVARLPISTLWAILFFLMLITLGLDSQFTIIESVVTAIVDEFPDKLRKHKTWVTLATCIVGYILGLTCVTRAGPYWASLIDSYASSFSILLFAIFECIGIAWIYGIKRFTNDIRTMIGNECIDFIGFKWWPLLWTSVTPAILIFIVMFNWLNWEEPSYSGMQYPIWGRVIGWLITLSAIVWIPVGMLFEFFKASGSLAERWRLMSSPDPKWGPALQKHRNEAWTVHREHGTTMGGKLEVPGHLGMKYTPGYNPQDNPGFE